MFSFPLYTTKGLEVINVKVGKRRGREWVGEASEGKAQSHMHYSYKSGFLMVSGMVAIIIHGYQT